MVDESPDLAALAAEAYVYGFPLLFNLSQVGRSIELGFGPMSPAPANTFAHAGTLADATTEFVSVNNDTLYSLAQVDTSGGPVRIDVPATGGRYFVLQLVDAWTNNFGYIGTRATGNDGGTFLFTPPGWEGSVPTGVRPIAAPTSLFTIVGRYACDGPDDIAAVQDLQAELVLTPSGAASDPVIPAPSEQVDAELLPWERLRTWMAAFPPGPADVEEQQRFAPLGLLEATSPYADPPSALRAALVAGSTAGTEQIEAASTARPASASSWVLNPHLFDYNLDHFELGSLDDPAWRMPDRRASYLGRAFAARAGLWGNHGYEAVYPFTFVDEAGEPLDGSRRYEIRFDEPLPAGAFWSLTMYDVPDYYLVDNPIDRYSIGDRTPGIAYADDGSLTISISRDRPTGAGEQANWLPAPEGAFRPMLRIYVPGPAILDGTYQLPPIRHLAD